MYASSAERKVPSMADTLYPDRVWASNTFIGPLVNGSAGEEFCRLKAYRQITANELVFIHPCHLLNMLSVNIAHIKRSIFDQVPFQCAQRSEISSRRFWHS